MPGSVLPGNSSLPAHLPIPTAPLPASLKQSAPASAASQCSRAGMAVGSHSGAETGRGPRLPPGAPRRQNLVTASRFCTRRAAACEGRQAASNRRGCTEAWYAHWDACHACLSGTVHPQMSALSHGTEPWH